jgi:DNA helicase II / ATP-dependent DNA helicase PcrA
MTIDYNSIFEENYDKLNSAQKQAVDTIDGPVMVLAGPGAGKTQLLSLRVANILRLTDTRPNNILCLTYTDSGAKNMKDRLSKIIGPEAYKANIMTFHTFAKSIMNLHPEKFFKGANPKLMDDYTRKLLYKSILEDIRKNNFKNSLTIYNKEQGYVYQNIIDKRIKQFKGNGITPKALEAILNKSKLELDHLNDILSRYFSQTMSMKVYSQIPHCLEELKSHMQVLEGSKSMGNIKTLTENYYQKIQEAYQMYTNDPEVKSTPLSKFKSNYLFKQGGRCLPLEAKYLDKYYDLLEVYYSYDEKIEEGANIDFDDVIRILVETLQQDDELRLLVQSKYQYVLVDEFQDTSLVQLNLITSLLNMEITEGRPNILVVGDDDQSIYKFQGANVDNLMKFVQYFESDPTLIALNVNYRSAKNIVELSKEIIDYSMVRFSNIFKDFNKDIVPFKKENGAINYLSYNTFYDEVADICKRIKLLSDEDCDLSEICVLARNHKQIVPFARHLELLGIPLKYEKGQDILKSQHILELIKLCQLVLNIVDAKYVDVLLSEVLCSEYWQIPAIDIYKLAATARRVKRTWLETMLDATAYDLNLYFYDIAIWLIDTSAIAKRYSAERLLDIMIGQKSDEGGEQSAVELNIVVEPELQKWRDYLHKLSIFSPFGRYYYNLDRLNLEYLATLSALKTLINKVREYRKTSFLKIVDLVDFFQFHIDEKIAIIDNNVFNQDAKAVTLMTGHKSKGLEYEHVFVISANDDVWFDSKTFGNKIPLLSNMPFEGIPEDDDDKLRLLYVAITRAKTNLNITRYENDESDKVMNAARVLVSKEFQKIEVPKAELAEIVAENVFDRSVNVDISMEKLLRPLIEDYKMPVTHLWNYIDLDNDRGPKYFIENNLLRFPCSKNASSSYGTAIHAALHAYYTKLKINPNFSEQELVKEFIMALDSENLEEKDYRHYREKGIESMKNYYHTRIPERNYKTEVDFNYEDVMIGQAKVTGKIDKLVYNKMADGTQFLDVVDYKTGKGVASLKSQAKNIDNYKIQLMFYKLMIEHSSLMDGNTQVGSLCLDFVEKGENNGIKELPLIDIEIDIITLKKLIEKVYNKIINLDFKVPKEISELKSGKNVAFKNWLLNTD